MPTLLYKNYGLVKGIGFDSWRGVGSLMQSVKIYNMREVDELVFFDITATSENRGPDLTLIDEFADECFMPLAVGGGIRTIDDVKDVLRVGADKVVVNSAALEDSNFVRAIADRFGSQCVVVAIDVMGNSSSGFEIMSHCGKRATGLDPVSHVQKMEACGAGEILITSIERDGTMSGYDIDLIKKCSEVIKIPLIASGGAGNYQHMADAIIEGGATAVAAASIFHFTQQTPMEAKKYLREKGISVRI